MTSYTLTDLLREFPSRKKLPASCYPVQQVENQKNFFVVLDDDPTGTQAISELPILTQWEVADFEWALSTGANGVYVITNSRSMSPKDAEKANFTAVEAATVAANNLGRSLIFASRSDSTMRGHFPLETETISRALAKQGNKIDAVILVPAFPEAGRITINSVHYAGSQELGYYPVAETEYAQDETFGYKNSNLKEWVEEKSEGTISSSEITSITLSDIRGNFGNLVEKFMQTHNCSVFICDAVEDSDLDILAGAIDRAETQGKRFIYRVGPSFMRARLGQKKKLQLAESEVAQVGKEYVAIAQGEIEPGGLIIVGSHTDLTTSQLHNLLSRYRSIDRFELDVEKLIDSDNSEQYIREMASKAGGALREGNIVLSTSRTLLKGNGKDHSLEIARDISAGLMRAVEIIVANHKPRFVVAKGGITSSDTAKIGLKINHAWTPGTLLPGIVSLWTVTDGPSRGLPYVVFPGNVGGETSLTEVVSLLNATSTRA